MLVSHGGGTGGTSALMVLCCSGIRQICRYVTESYDKALLQLTNLFLALVNMKKYGSHWPRQRQVCKHAIKVLGFEIMQICSHCPAGTYQLLYVGYYKYAGIRIGIGKYIFRYALCSQSLDISSMHVCTYCPRLK